MTKAQKDFEARRGELKKHAKRPHRKKDLSGNSGYVPGTRIFFWKGYDGNPRHRRFADHMRGRPEACFFEPDPVEKLMMEWDMQELYENDALPPEYMALIRDREGRPFEEQFGEFYVPRQVWTKKPPFRRRKKEPDSGKVYERIMNGEMSDNESLILEAIGVRGLSRTQQIRDYVAENGGSLKTVETVGDFKALVDCGVLQKQAYRIGRLSTRCAYRLTEDKGLTVFIRLFGRKPCRDELTEINCRHQNPTHGYGVIYLRDVLLKKGYTGILEDRRECASAILPDWKRANPNFGPDLVATDPATHEQEVFEYETGRTAETYYKFFRSKMDHLVPYIQILRVVLPSRSLVMRAANKFERWVGDQGGPDHVDCCVSFIPLFDFEHGNDRYRIDYDYRKPEPLNEGR